MKKLILSLILLPLLAIAQKKKTIKDTLPEIMLMPGEYNGNGSVIYDAPLTWNNPDTIRCILLFIDTVGYPVNGLLQFNGTNYFQSTYTRYNHESYWQYGYVVGSCMILFKNQIIGSSYLDENKQPLNKNWHVLSAYKLPNEQRETNVIEANQNELTLLPKDTLRHFYYRWYYNDRKTDAWGENDITLNHFPTKKEIISKYIPKDKGWVVSKIDVQIQEVTEKQLHQIYSPQTHQQKSMEAYYRAIYKK